MSKFLPGVLLIQLITTVLLFAALNWFNDFQLTIVLVVIALISALLVSLWFSSIAQNLAMDEQASMLEKHVKDRENILKQAEKEKSQVLKETSLLQDKHAKEREQLLLDAEKEKAKILEQSYQRIEKETRKINTKANLKVGIAFTAAVTAGGVMIFSQLITLGLMLMVASGSGLSGYLLRARQDRLNRKKQLLLSQNTTIQG